MTTPDVLSTRETPSESTREPVPNVIESIDLGASPRPEFEFTPSQERLMNELGGKMKFVGLIAMICGALMILDLIAEFAASGILRLSVLSLTPLLFLLIGVWTRQAGQGFQLVAATQERDVSHLMEALEAQARIFRLALWVFGLFVILILAGSIAARLS